MKKLTLLVLLLLVPINSYALEQTQSPRLVIIDTALDSSIPEINSRLVHEVCILDGPYCQNNKKFQEGPGSSSLPSNIINSPGFKHGTQMASAAIRTNPDLEIIFIRIIGHYKNGSRRPTTLLTIPNALDWVLKNHAKYNIKAVSMSQGNHNFGNKFINYCPFSSVNYYIKYLLAKNIPVFLPSGNQSDHKRIDWPACIPETVSVGGVNEDNTISLTSNYDKGIDLWERFSMTVSSPGGQDTLVSGTSISTQIAAANFIKILKTYSDYSVKDINNLIYSNMYTVTNSKGMLGKVIDMEKILSGK